MDNMDFGAPSFSLGLDLDLDSDPPSPPRESIPQSAGQISGNANLPRFEDEDDYGDFQLQESPEPDPAPVLKRLKRCPRSSTPPPSSSQRRPAQLPNADDDIEEFSSEEGGRTVEHQIPQCRSACSSSKISLHSQRVLHSQQASKLKTQDTPRPSVSKFSSLKGVVNEGTLPKLTISPLRRINILDSDSDDPSRKDRTENFKKNGVYGNDRHDSCAGTVNQQGISKTTKLQSGSSWTSFGSKENTKVATPAFDEFFAEYSTSKGMNTQQMKKGNTGFAFSNSVSNDQFPEEIETCQENITLGHGKHCLKQLEDLPPAYHYFHHNDARIRKLVKERLPNFLPVGIVNQEGSEHGERTFVDYMSQFGIRDAPSEVHAIGSSVHAHEGSSKTKSRRRGNANVMAPQSPLEGWVNPKTSTSIPKDAGKRRIHAYNADSHSAGHWYTDTGGRKVYVTKSGQELTGRAAYMHYRKESGRGFRRSKKKGAPTKRKSRK